MVRVTILSKTMSVIPEPTSLGLELTFDDIANVPVADASSVSDWNTFFDLPTNGSPFTSVEVIGNMVRLIGGSGITMSNFLFHENLNLIKVDDKSGSCIEIEISVFFGNLNCQYINLPECHTIGDGNFSELFYDGIIYLLPKAITVGVSCFSGTNYHILELPICQSIGNSSLSQSGILALNNKTAIKLPSIVTIGSTVGDNGIFGGLIGNTLELTIPAALMTCNGGNPDGDIQYLQANNTVTIVTV